MTRVCILSIGAQITCSPKCPCDSIESLSIAKPGSQGYLILCGVNNTLQTRGRVLILKSEWTKEEERGESSGSDTVNERMLTTCSAQSYLNKGTYVCEGI